MARSNSTQHKLDRVRPPRVHVTYDVEVGDAIEMKELPFVMGVLGDFTGQPTQPLPRLRDRKFVEVNPGQLRSGARRHEAAPVIQRRKQAERRFGCSAAEGRPPFQEHGRLRSGEVAKQVKPLRELMDLRTKLADLRGSLQGNDKLEELLHGCGQQTRKSWRS